MLLILPHQAVEMLVYLEFPLAVFESLDVLVDTGAKPVLFGLIALLALTLCLHLPVQELLGLQFLLFIVINFHHLSLSMSIFVNHEDMKDMLEVSCRLWFPVMLTASTLSSRVPTPLRPLS